MSDPRCGLLAVALPTRLTAYRSSFTWQIMGAFLVMQIVITKPRSFTTIALSAALISVSLFFSHAPTYAARPRIRGYSASRDVSVYSPAFARTRCVYTTEGWPG